MDTLNGSLTRYIIIDKEDDVHLKIEAEDSIRRDLGQFFTFEVPGFKFMPQYTEAEYGTERLDCSLIRQVKIYAGLYPYIKKWCEDNNVHVVDGTKIQDTKVDEAKVDKFIEALKIPLKVRDYQKEAFIYAVERIEHCYFLLQPLENLLLSIYLLDLTFLD